MVGGRDTIIWTEETVERSLSGYKERAYLESVAKSGDPTNVRLDACLEKLKPCEKDLVKKLCIERLSERAYATETGMTRYRVRKEKQRLLRLTAAALNARTADG